MLGSNDTGLKSLLCPGAEPIFGHINKQTDIFEYYNIDKLYRRVRTHSKTFGIFKIIKVFFNQKIFTE